MFQVLHPHHAHMLDVKYSLLNLLGHTDHSSLENLTGQNNIINLSWDICQEKRID